MHGRKKHQITLPNDSLICHMRTNRRTRGEGMCLQNLIAKALRRLYSKLKHRALIEDSVIDIELSYF